MNELRIFLDKINRNIAYYIITFIFILILILNEDLAAKSVSKWIFNMTGINDSLLLLVIAALALSWIPGFLSAELFFYIRARFGQHDKIIKWLLSTCTMSVDPNSTRKDTIVKLFMCAINKDENKYKLREIEESFSQIADAKGEIPVDLLKVLNVSYKQSKTHPKFGCTLKYFFDAYAKTEPLDYIDLTIKLHNETQNIKSPLTYYITSELNSLRKRVEDLSGTPGITYEYHKWGQFIVATSIAEWQSLIKSNDKKGFTFRATSLDTPSKFFSNYGKDYFKKQIDLADFGDNKIVDKSITRQSNSSYDNKANECPAKARIVIIEFANIIDEILDKDKISKFTSFLDWHVKYNYGVKFLIAEDAWNIKAGITDYQSELSQGVSENEDCNIDDFVVYNSKVVFGRTNLVIERIGESQGAGLVNIKIEKNNKVAGRYDVFFCNRLWGHAKSKVPLDLFCYLEKVEIKSFLPPDHSILKRYKLIDKESYMENIKKDLIDNISRLRDGYVKILSEKMETFDNSNT